MNLDIWRGLGVVLMVIFHLAFDLDYFQFVDLDFTSPGFWYYFPRGIVFIFLTAAGASLRISHQGGIRPDKVRRQTLKLGFFALAISAVTFALFPKQGIFFGTIHCLLCCYLFWLPWSQKRYLGLWIFLLVIPQHLYFQWTWFNFPQMLGIVSLDYIPFYPWFAVMGLGIYIPHHWWEKKIFPPLAERLFAPLGANSLFIYLTHQVILFSATGFAKFILTAVT